MIGKSWMAGVVLAASLLSCSICSAYGTGVQAAVLQAHFSDGSAANNESVSSNRDPGQNGAAETTVSGTVLDAAGEPVPGKVAVMDGTGNIRVEDTDANGQFQVTVPTPAGQGGQGTVGIGAGGGTAVQDKLSVIGVWTSDVGWVGTDVPVTSLRPLQVQAVQGMTTLSGRLHYIGKKYPVTEVSIRNVLTQAHYYAKVSSSGQFSLTVPVGPYETFALLTQQDPIFLASPFIAPAGRFQLTVPVPALPAHGQVTSVNAVVKAGDNKVSAQDLLTIDNLFEHIVPLDETDLGLTLKGRVTVTLYSSLQSYQKHFEDEGYSASEAKNYAENSLAVCEGPHSISVSMYSFGAVDGINILAHEFTHALIDTVSDRLPSWVNEGIAWHQGVEAQMDNSPSDILLAGAQWTQWADIVKHQQDGTLIALGQADTLDDNYNVESQDYFAVEQLIRQAGFDKVLSYVRQVDGDQNAFYDVFQQSVDDFSKQVTSALEKTAAQTDNGFSISIRVLPNGPHRVYVQAPNGTRKLLQGLQPGNTYTIRCRANGAVDAGTGVTVESVSALQTPDSGDWFIGYNAADQSASNESASQAAAVSDPAGSRQEFEIANEYGTPFLVTAVLYDGQGRVQHYYPAIALPAGIEIVQLQPLP